MGGQQERRVECDRGGEDSGDGPALRDASAHRAQRVGRGGGPAAGRDGQFGSRASHDWLGARHLPGPDANHESDRERSVRAQRDDCRCDQKDRRARHYAAYLGSALRRQRAQSYRSSEGAPRRRRGERCDPDCGSCSARRTRQAAALGARFRRSTRSEAEATRTRPNRDGHRTLLCDGSRQAMGSNRARVARDGRRRRSAGVERA